MTPIPDSEVEVQPDWFLQLHFSKCPTKGAGVGLLAGELSTFCPELLYELQRQGPSSALIAIDGGAKENKVGSQQIFDNGEGYGSCLIDDKQLCLSQLLMMLWLDILDSLQHARMTR